MKSKKLIKTISMILAIVMLSCAVTACVKPAGDTNTTPTPDNGQSGNAGTIHLAQGTGMINKGDVEKAYIFALNAFSVELVKNMGEDWTGVVSPLSFALMLELLANGADEETSGTILSALMTELGLEETNENAAKLINALNKSVQNLTSKATDQSGKATEPISKVKLLSTILVGAGDRFLESFEHAAADYYNASIGEVDFRNTEEALRLINGWVSENTEGLIPELFDDIAGDTVMALVNALYFNSEWQKPFTAFKDTSIFHGVNGDSAVTMLSSYSDYRYGNVNGNQFVLIPYKGGDYYMALILPEKSTSPAEAMGEVVDKLDTAQSAMVSIMMPQVSVSSKFDAMPLLAKLGLEGIANGTTLFPGIIENGTVFLTQFVHAAVLKVTEFGTEAAAATGVTGTKNAAPVGLGEYTMVCDRPYAMLIMHSSGSVLFASTVNDVPAN